MLSMPLLVWKLVKKILPYLVGSISIGGGLTNPQCGHTAYYSIPEGKGASFFCRPSLYGKYVTVNSLLNAPLTLCEVEVYSTRRGMIIGTSVCSVSLSLFCANVYSLSLILNVYDYRTKFHRKKYLKVSK